MLDTLCDARIARNRRIIRKTRTNLPARSMGRLGMLASRSIHPHFMNSSFDFALWKRIPKSRRSRKQTPVSTHSRILETCPGNLKAISILSASEIFRVSTTSPMLQIIGRRMRTKYTPLARRMAPNCLLTIRGCFTRGFLGSPGTGWYWPAAGSEGALSRPPFQKADHDFIWCKTLNHGFAKPIWRGHQEVFVTGDMALTLQADGQAAPGVSPAAMKWPNTWPKPLRRKLVCGRKVRRIQLSGMRTKVRWRLSVVRRMWRGSSVSDSPGNWPGLPDCWCT